MLFATPRDASWTLQEMYKLILGPNCLNYGKKHLKNLGHLDVLPCDKSSWLGLSQLLFLLDKTNGKVRNTHAYRSIAVFQIDPSKLELQD